MNLDDLPEGMRAVPIRKLKRKQHSDWLAPPASCPCCTGQVRLVNNMEIYGRSYGNWPFAYKCDGCGATIGVHPNSIYPVGTLANRALREERQRVHDALDRMRREDWVTVSVARERLAQMMKIPVAACRIATFDIELCRKALHVIAASGVTQGEGHVAAVRLPGSTVQQPSARPLGVA
jgi:hypothetical protein